MADDNTNNETNHPARNSSERHNLADGMEDVFSDINQKKEHVTGLDKVDFSQVKTNKSTRARNNKKKRDDPSDQMKREIIDTAKKLLAIAGTSVDELGSKRPEKRRRDFVPKREADELFGSNLASDVTVVGSNTDPIESVKLENSTDYTSQPKSGETFVPKSSDERYEEDPFAEDIILSNAEMALLKEKTSNIKHVPVKAKNGFFYYFGIAALALTILGAIGGGGLFILKLFSNDEQPQYQDLVKNIEQQEAKPEIKSVSQKTLIETEDPIIQEAASVVEKFMLSESVRIAYAFIQQTKDIDKLFSERWEKQNTYDPSMLNYDRGYYLEGQRVIVRFFYGKEENKRQMVLSKAENAAFKLDWKTFTELEQVSLAEVKQSNTTSPQLIRAWVKQEENYTTNYSDQFWRNYVGYDLAGSTLDCYIAREQTTARTLFDKMIETPMTHPIGGEDGAYVIMLVRKPSIDASHVEILDVLSTAWHEELDDYQVDTE